MPNRTAQIRRCQNYVGGGRVREFAAAMPEPTPSIPEILYRVDKLRESLLSLILFLGRSQPRQDHLLVRKQPGEEGQRRLRKQPRSDTNNSARKDDDAQPASKFKQFVIGLFRIDGRTVEKKRLERLIEASPDSSVLRVVSTITKARPCRTNRCNCQAKGDPVTMPPDEHHSSKQIRHKSIANLQFLAECH